MESRFFELTFAFPFFTKDLKAIILALKNKSGPLNAISIYTIRIYKSKTLHFVAGYNISLSIIKIGISKVLFFDPTFSDLYH